MIYALILCLFLLALVLKYNDVLGGFRREDEKETRRDKRDE